MEDGLLDALIGRLSDLRTMIENPRSNTQHDRAATAIQCHELALTVKRLKKAGHCGFCGGAMPCASHADL